MYFPNGNYFSAYEAGFCDLSAHYKQEELGIHSIVINLADVPTTQKEQMLKSDPVDSKKKDSKMPAPSSLLYNAKRLLLIGCSPAEPISSSTF